MTPDSLRDPAALRRLSVGELYILAEDLRQIILSTCLKNGGHLGASLGTVELAIALHIIFESPREPLVWDVGHQAYAHKLLTGRLEKFSSLRLEGGISGFLSRAESEHDVFGAGHSSTALSAALAMAWARRGSEDWTVAVMGDGGLTAGLSFEALNNFRELSLGPLLVVLNDNHMSISRNLGAVSTQLSGSNARNYFNFFGLEYSGPIDGHDLSTLLETLEGIRKNFSGKPILLHVITQKGRGYSPAEDRPASYHGVAPLQEKVPGQSQSRRETYSEVFGRTLCHLAESDPRVVAITAAMSEGTGLSEFANRFPDRFFDVGIAEQHAVTFAAGLATQGFRPVVAIYSTFLQRALDQVIHDVSLQNLGVTFAVDRAGIVGADGPTHHGAFDLAFLGMIPNMRVTAPASLQDLRETLAAAIQSGQPWAIRYPRGSGVECFAERLSDGFRWHRKMPSPKIVVIAAGSATPRVLDAAASADPAAVSISALSVIDLKPISENLLREVSRFSDVPIFVVEDGSTRGGFGQDLLGQLGLRRAPSHLKGFADHFIRHGSPASLEESEGISKDALARQFLRILESV